ncbi:MAG: hypothetical protein ACP6IP_03815 [Candidatus Njordarchaeia archaeon]
MSFFRRKKEKAREESEPTLGLKPKEKSEKMYVEKKILGEGLLATITESEETNIGESKKAESKGEGTIVVESKSNSPIFSIELNLDNITNTTLKGKKVFIPMLKKENGRYVWRQKYEIKGKVLPAINVDRELKSENGPTILVKGRPTRATFTITIKNNLNTRIDNIALRQDLPKNTKIISHNETTGYVSVERSILKWDKISLEPLASSKLDVELEITVNENKPVDFGGTSLLYTIANGTISGLAISNIIGKSNVKHTISKKQRSEDPNMWDVNITLENPNNHPINVSGTLKITNGKILPNESRKSEGFTVTEGSVEVKNISLSPLSKVEFGPIAVSSKEMPKFDINLEGNVKAQSTSSSSGKIEIGSFILEVIGGELSKKTSPIVDELLKDIVADNEIPTLTKTPIEVETHLVNTGSTNIGYLKFVETIPKGFSNPEKLVIEIKGKNVTKSFTTKIEPSDNIEEERRFIIESVATTFNLKEGEEIKVKYTINSVKPMLNKKFVKFDSRAEIGASKDSVKTEINLPAGQTPELKIKQITQEIETSHKIEPLETENHFKVTIEIKNKSNIPAVGYNLKINLPKEFTLKEHNLKPEKIEEKEKYTLVTWKIDLIPPREKREIWYIVEGKGEYRIEQLMSIKEN